MKRILLFVLVLGIAYSASAQETNKRISTKLPAHSVAVEPPSNIGSDYSDKVDQEDHSTTIDGRAVSFINIGDAGNAQDVRWYRDGW